MRRIVFIAAAIGASISAGWILAAENAKEQDARQLEPLCREVQRLVRRYYPKADFSLNVDEKTRDEKFHFEYNTQIFRMRDAKTGGTVDIRGPYVGGIWCDITLLKGRYDGTAERAEDGFTRIGPDYYSRLVAPYSKELDRHIEVVLRYPGGTPPEFLKRFDVLVKNFERYMAKPVQ